MLQQLISFLRLHPNQIAAFATKFGINRQSVDNLINDGEQLSFEQLKLVASKMKVSLSQLLTNSSQKPNFHFRSNAESLNQLIINEKVGFLVDSIHPVVAEYAEPSSIPDKSQHKFISDSEIASNILRLALLDDDYSRPLLDLAELLAAKLNVFVIVKDVGADGVSVYIDGYAYIVISPRFASRMLFTLAHELGHLVLQHHQNGLRIDFVQPDFYNTNSKNKFESFANQFGSNLLMPKSAFARRLLAIKAENSVPESSVSDLEILSLAYYFGVSFQAAAMRCEQLSLLPAGSARSIYQAVSKQDKSPELRGRRVGIERNTSPLFPVAASNNVLYALFRAIENGNISASKAATVLGLKMEQLLVLHSQLSNELHNG